jgi:AAHS family benzoate transporter-like MFS transporter
VTGTGSRSGLAVVAVCFLTIVCDGYDLIVYGSVLPSLLAEPGWGIGPAEAGAIGSYALAGMLVGALAAGAITDAVGRRKIVLVGIVWFSLAMGLCALAPSAGLLGMFRLGFEWNFYGFAVPALVGALLIALVPRVTARVPEKTEV